MKHVMLSTLLLLMFFQLKAQGSDDAVKHFGAGIVIGGVGGYAAHKIFDGKRGWTWVGAVGSSFGAAIAKETLYDQPRGASFEGRDVLFTTLGGIVSGLALDVLTSNTRRRTGGGKYCGCLVVENSEIPDLNLPLNPETGSRDITAVLQAAYLLR
ncbi:hypothetical protein Q2T41_03705 [Maribacter confluentis]|uniref:Glycine zipper 2TM domain-containing protein n=1 Tax=Maribacter confluentis TaxID=1656093 RepID=A0ABT8RN55_9FLAO|nr:hypothetical protein [Maribacter confluentis]MDO1511769.1 hypothetical protein [Maribacter confluentis]